MTISLSPLSAPLSTNTVATSAAASPAAASLTQSQASQNDSFSQTQPKPASMASKTSDEKPFALSIGASLAEVAVGASAYKLASNMAKGSKIAGAVGFLLGGAVTGGSISAFWQKRTTGSIDRQRVYKDSAKGSLGL